MARSPLPGKAGGTQKAKPGRQPLPTFHRALPRRSRPWKLRFAHLLRVSNHFRMGIHYAIRRRLLQPWKIKTKIVHVERPIRVPDTAVVKQLEGLKRRNLEIVKDNARAKSERFSFQKSLNAAYKTDLNMHEISVENDALKRMCAKLLVFCDDLKVDGEKIQEFKDHLPDYKVISQSQPANSRRFTLDTRYPNYFPLHVYSPGVGRLEEQREQVAGPESPKLKKAARPSMKRRTAMPGEIERTIADMNRLRQRQAREEDEQEPAGALPLTPIPSPGAEQVHYKSFKNPRKTPEHKGGDSAEKANRVEEDSLADRTYNFEIDSDDDHVPDLPRILPTAARPALQERATPKKKRPFEAVLQAEGIQGRRSVGVRASPRLKAQARRSLQASLGELPHFDDTDNIPKESNCSGKGISLEDDDDDLENLSQSAVEPSWSSTLNDSNSAISRVSAAAITSDDEYEGVSTPVRRPSRAAKERIQTMKEPSLNKKMRRPAHVEPLRKEKKVSARRATKTAEVIVVSD